MFVMSIEFQSLVSLWTARKRKRGKEGKGKQQQISGHSSRVAADRCKSQFIALLQLSGAHCSPIARACTQTDTNCSNFPPNSLFTVNSNGPTESLLQEPLGLATSNRWERKFPSRAGQQPASRWSAAGQLAAQIAAWGQSRRSRANSDGPALTCRAGNCYRWLIFSPRRATSTRPSGHYHGPKLAGRVGSCAELHER